jgi:hypothetical protein
MPYIEPPFVFGSKQNHVVAGDFVLPLPGGLQNKSDLLSHYVGAGHFPAYFGNNWDALNDCLRDFSWIKQKRIVIAHDDLPLLNSEKELLPYLEILVDAVKFWKPHEQHELLVVFPQEAEVAVARLLDERKNP